MVEKEVILTAVTDHNELEILKKQPEETRVQVVKNIDENKLYPPREAMTVD